MKRLLQVFLAIALLVAGGLTCSKPTPVAPSEAVLSISADPLRISATGVSEITVIGRQMDGSPVNEGTEIILTTTLGSIDRVVVADDRGVAVAELVGDGTIGMATVEASSGAAAPAMVEVQIGSLASFLTLSVNPRSLTRDLPPSGAEITLSAIVQDDTNGPLERALVTFGSERGTLASGGIAVETDVDGVATDTLTVFAEDLASVSEGEFRVFARTACEEEAPDCFDGQIEAEDFIEVSGFAAEITLEASPPSVPQEGGSIELIALVLDNAFEPLEGAGVNFITEVGTLASRGLVLTDADGVATDILTVTSSQIAAAANTSFFDVSAEVEGIGSDPVRIRIEGVTSLTLVKEVDNAGGGTATSTQWELTATGPSPFSGFGTASSSDVWGSNFEPGVYSLSESGPSGYTNVGWVCTGAASAGGSPVTIEEGQLVVCTILNSFGGATLTLQKNVINDSDPPGTATASDWTLTATGPTTFQGSGSGVTRVVDPGSYTLSESGPADYTADPWICSGATGVTGNTVTLSAGDEATCTITNRDQ
jgi:hypothetical protein